jgi:hypothetical protein
MTDAADLVERSLAPETAESFAERLATQAAALREGIEAGDYDSPEFAVGLEVEVYAVSAGDDRPDGTGVAAGTDSPADGAGTDDPADATDSPADADRGGRLVSLPDAVFEGPANKELGLHNAELNTDPEVLDGEGLAAQAEAIADRIGEARTDAAAHGCELVLDAMWTVPPGEGSYDYLATVDCRDDVTIARNMRPDPRYLAIDNHCLDLAGGRLPFSVPGYEGTFPTILFESLATSIQPHLQIPSATALPRYYNAAIRTLGPVLALSTNSPFLPGDLYDVTDPERLIEQTHHELRIAAFEQSVNHTGTAKVRVPRDIEAAADVVDRVVADDLCAPFLREWLEDSARTSHADRVWEFDHKRSTYWRWLRCVVGGDPVGTGDERSLRIEYRPIPTQPTVRDVVGMQALTAGLLRGLVAADHPITDLPWAVAERSFYAAAADGLGADLAWITADGDRTGDAAVVFDEVFEYARRGLRAAGLDPADVDRYLDPIEARREAGTTPSAWKKARVREGLEDGRDLKGAIEGMQREYVRRSRETETFAEWL